MPSAPAPEPAVRPPRKRFILIGLGIGLLIILIVGLTTSIGTNSSTTSQPSEGGPVPTFSATNVGPTGSGQVSVPADGGGNGTPAVLLFFGAWCDSCRQELPPLAAAVRQQDKAGGALAKVQVIGVDSFDSTSTAKSFIHEEGVTFPVACRSAGRYHRRSLLLPRRPLRRVRQGRWHDRPDCGGRPAHAVIFHG